MNDAQLVASLGRLVGTMDSSEQSILLEQINAARAYLAPYIEGQDVPQAVIDDCTLSVAADLWQARDARNGIVGLTADGIEPFRISSDPLRTAWPKLRAAGVPAGMGIA